MRRICALLMAVALWPAGVSAADAVRIEAATLAVDHSRRQAEFKGEVKLTRSDFTLRCDRLVAYYREQAGGELERAEAYGHVRMTQGEKWGSAEKAIYRQMEGTLTLLGHAEVAEPAGAVHGEQVVHYVEDGHTEVLKGTDGGRVKLSVEPEKMEGKHKAAGGNSQ